MKRCRANNDAQPWGFLDKTQHSCGAVSSTRNTNTTQLARVFSRDAIRHATPGAFSTRTTRYAAEGLDQDVGVTSGRWHLRDLGSPQSAALAAAWVAEAAASAAAKSCGSLSIAAWRSEWHKRPLAFLVGFQAFRILVELAIHQAVVEGVAPPQMSWEGRNFDILTGITALLLIPVVDRLPSWSLHAWNFAGAVLLLNIVSVAMLSLPTPFQLFEPDNVWLLFFPFTWLPLILAMMAWLGHVC